MRWRLTWPDHRVATRNTAFRAFCALGVKRAEGCGVLMGTVQTPRRCHVTEGSEGSVRFTKTERQTEPNSYSLGLQILVKIEQHFTNLLVKSKPK